MNEIQRKRIELPATPEDLAAQYSLKRDRTLNDSVEQHFRALITDTDFRRYIMEIRRQDAVEGDLFLDDTMAAQMVRKRALELNDQIVAGEKLKTLVGALKVVMRRFKVGREQRRDLVGNGDDE